MEGHSGWVYSVALSADGKRALSGAHDRTVKLWDLETGACLNTMEGHSGSVWSVALSADGKRALSGAGDRTVKLWDLETGACLNTMEGHSDSVEFVEFTNSGQQICSSARNGVVRIWSASEETDTVKNAIAENRLYTNAKIVLLGESGVGKSGLAHRLIDDKFVQTYSTHGMQVWRIDLPIDAQDGLEREALLWDLAGQKDYRLIHQLFLDETSLALILIDPQKDDPLAPAVEWCKILKSSCPNAHKRLLVAARIDVGPINIGQAKIDRFREEFGIVKFLETSAKRGDNCSDRQSSGPHSVLKQLIANTIPWSQIETTTTPKTWAAVKNSILDMTEIEDIRLLRFSELAQQLRNRKAELELKASTIRSAVQLLSNHGLVMPFDFGDLVLLQPGLLNGYASSVINAARAHQDEIGSVSESDLFGEEFDFDQCDRLPRNDEVLPTAGDGADLS